MNNIFIDASNHSLIKHGEELCGDMVQVVKENDDVIMVLADGMGSGVKANILATLTSKIISTMVAKKMSIEDCVRTISSTLPVCKVRNVAYSTFTIIKITDGKYAQIIQYDNPKTILLRKGKNFEYPVITRLIDGKEITEATIKLQNDDVFIAMSDGVIYAGDEEILNYGWQRENVVEYIESKYNYKLTAKEIGAIIIDACNELYAQKPSDDTTVSVIQIRKRKSVNLIFGPSKNPEDDDKMLKEFFGEKGRYIVCGGTTAHIVASHLGEKIENSTEELDPEIPPMSKIKGIDLVTEGIITMSKVLNNIKDFNGENKLYKIWGKKNDGASRITRYLLNEATDVSIFVGCAINEAYQDAAFAADIDIKLRIAKDIEKELKRLDKTVKVSYF